MSSHSESYENSHVAPSGTLSTNLTTQSETTFRNDSTPGTSSVGTRACYSRDREGRRVSRLVQTRLCYICGNSDHADPACPWKRSKTSAAPKLQDHKPESATATNQLEGQENSSVITEAPDLMDLDSEDKTEEIPQVTRDAYGNLNNGGRFAEANTCWQDGKEAGPVDMSTHLLDTPITTTDEGILITRQVALSRKRKGKKGKKAMYDLTPFLSY